MEIREFLQMHSARLNADILADKIEDALSKARAAYEKLTASDTQGAVGEIEGAVGDLEAAVEDLGAVVKGHPTLSEAITEAALDWSNESIHLIRKASG